MSLTKFAVVLLVLGALFCLYTATLPADDHGIFKHFNREYRAAKKDLGKLEKAARSLEGARVIVQDIGAEQEISAIIDKDDAAQLEEAIGGLTPAPRSRGSKSAPPRPLYHIHLHLTNGTAIVLHAPGYWKDPRRGLLNLGARLMQKYPTRPYELSESEKHNKKASEERQRFDDERATNGTP